MEFIKNNRFLGAAPKEVPIEDVQTSLVIHTEIIADTTIPENNGIITLIPEIEPTNVPEPSLSHTNTLIDIIPEVTDIPTVEITFPDKPLPITAAIVPEKIPELTFVPDATHVFRDIPINSSLYQATKFLSEAGVAHGYADGGFHPDDQLSRSEAILLYDRLFKSSEETKDINLPFLDVLPSDELGQALSRAFTRKIVVNSKYFRPNDSLTRAEAITLLVRTSGIPPYNIGYSLFKDVKVGNSHRIYINTFAQYL